jgi:hypothetical protein
VDEPDFAIASFLLSVMGEGTFLTLLRFPRAPRARACHASHYAIGSKRRGAARRFWSCTLEGIGKERSRIARQVGTFGARRHDARCAHGRPSTRRCWNALTLLAAGAWDHDALREGSRRVTQLIHDMDIGRRTQLCRIGFEENQAGALSRLHTRNFM